MSIYSLSAERLKGAHRLYLSIPQPHLKGVKVGENQKTNTSDEHSSTYLIGVCKSINPYKTKYGYHL